MDSKINDKKKADDNKKFIYALGRRKTATARVALYESGKGEIIVNDKNFRDYFPYYFWQENLELPFQTIGMTGKFDVTIKVVGGGMLSQSEACRLGIARALIKNDENYRKILRTVGYLTRDPRAKERKKPGLKRARRAPQWAKR